MTINWLKAWAAPAVWAMVLAGCGGASSNGGHASSTATSGGQRSSGAVALTVYHSSNAAPLSATAGLAAAERLAAAEQARSTAAAPTNAVNAKDAKGKTMLIVPILSDIPIAKVTNDAITAALHLAGANTQIIDGQGQVAVQTRGIGEAVTRGSAALTLEAIPARLVQAPLAQVASAKVPVIEAFEWNPGLPPLDEQKLGVAAQISYCYTCAGKAMADFVTADSRGNADVAVVGSSDQPTSALEIGAMRDEFRRLCPQCKLKTADAPQSQGPGRLPTLTRTLVNQDPHLNYILPVFDVMALSIVPSLHQAGANTRIKVVTFNATPAVLQLLARGDTVAADVGVDQVWASWGIADEFFRVTAHQPALALENVPMRTFTRNNIHSIDLSAAQSTWYGSGSFKSQFMKTWGLG